MNGIAGDFPFGSKRGLVDGDGAPFGRLADDGLARAVPFLFGIGVLKDVLNGGAESGGEAGDLWEGLNDDDVSGTVFGVREDAFDIGADRKGWSLSCCGGMLVGMDMVMKVCTSLEAMICWRAAWELSGRKERVA